MKHTLLLTLLAVFTISCAKRETTYNGASSQQVFPPNADVPAYVPDQTGPGYADAHVYGATAPMQISSVALMGEYTGRPMYHPQQVEINVNLAKYGDSHGGTIRISYSDLGQRHEGYFTAGHTQAESQYNTWFKSGGKNVWHGFFEDYLGAIVVVIDQVTDLGDGATEDVTASGSVWFKNFGYTYAPRPPSWCWFVSLGPYDCRAWKSGEGVNTKKAVYPDNGYKKLGTFSDLNLNGAFNGDI